MQTSTTLPILLLAASSLSACMEVSTWEHNDITNPQEMAELKAVDTAYCNQSATAAAPIPSIPAPSAQDQTLLIDHFNRGYTQARETAAADRARRLQYEIFTNCMIGRGWMKV